MYEKTKQQYQEFKLKYRINRYTVHLLMLIGGILLSIFASFGMLPIPEYQSNIFNSLYALGFVLAMAGIYGLNLLYFLSIKDGKTSD